MWLPRWVMLLIWIGIGVAFAVMLLFFWWQGTLGYFFRGLATPPVERL